MERRIRAKLERRAQCHWRQLPVDRVEFDVWSFQMLDLRRAVLADLFQVRSILERFIDLVEPSLKLIRRPDRNSPTVGVA